MRKPGLILIAIAVIVIVSWTSLALWTGKSEPVPLDINVVLVTLDTLRTDRLGLYGGPRENSPLLDKLAAESVVFDNLFAQSSFTTPSHASLFTSLYVNQHGLLTWNDLPDEHQTLAEILRDRGYQTVGVVNLQLLSRYGLGQGFEERIEQETEDTFVSARTINDSAVEWLRANGQRRFFMWIHYYDVHGPYGGDDETVQYYESQQNIRVGKDIGWYNLKPDDRVVRGMTGKNLEFMMYRYDAGVRYADESLSELIDEFKQLGIWTKTLLIVTSDHGESLDERESHYFSHDPFLFDQVTRITGLIRFPDVQYAGTRVRDLVESIDLAPTILTYLGLPVPSAFVGTDLLPLIRGDVPGRDAVFSESWGWRIAKSIRTVRWKLIWDAKSDTARLFDLEEDPAETVDVSERFPEVTADLRARMMQLGNLGGDATLEMPTLDPATVRRIQALGYTAGTEVESDDDD